MEQEEEEEVRYDKRAKITVTFEVAYAPGEPVNPNYFMMYLSDILEIPQCEGEPFDLLDVNLKEVTE